MTKQLILRHDGWREADRALIIATFPFAESMGLKGDFRQWQDLLRIGD